MVKSQHFPLVRGILGCVILFSSHSHLTKQVVLIHFGREHQNPERLSHVPKVTELVSEGPGLGPIPIWPPCPCFYRCVEPPPKPPEKDLWDQS